jgi:6-phosphogluconolactonase
MKKLLSALATLLLAAPLAASAADYYVYFGTHNLGPNRGFSLAHFNSDTGNLTTPQFLLAAAGPAFFQIHPDGLHLYACNTLGSKTEGQISAYAIDPKTGNLTFLNSQPSGGADPSYISFDKTGRFCFVANYNAGNLAAFPILPDGSLGNRTGFDQHAGHSIDPVRQKQPYAHSIIVDPSNRFVLSADLGLDKLFVYKFNAQTGNLTPNDPPFIATQPGAGPRHVVFAPNGKYVYLIHEMGSLITQFAWDSSNGTLKQLSTISTLPADFKGINTDAEIAFSPDGKFLYASDRGLNALTTFSVDPADGHLTVLDFTPTQGKTPRNFSLDPTGRWIIASNQDSATVIVYHRDPATGKLTQTGPLIPLDYPFCERFLAVPADSTAAPAPASPLATSPASK